MTLVMDRRVFLGTFDCDTAPRGWHVRGQVFMLSPLRPRHCTHSCPERKCHWDSILERA